MRATIGICTWNRASLLNQTLARMLTLRIPSGLDWEVLVVNNNSTDHTESVLASYENSLPLRRLFEGTPGKSHALNLAIHEAQGDLILWTDDDVLVDRDWLAAYVAAAERWPEAAFFGGPIEPWFDGEPPAWLRQVYPKVKIAFAMRDLGKDPCSLDERRLPFGANMAIRTAVQRRYLYDFNLGPRPNSQLRGEEIAVLEEMKHDGFEGRWVPAARVQHFIPKHRQTIKYLRSYYRGYGQSRALKTNQEPGARLFGRPRWVWRKAVENDMLFYLKKLCCKPEFWIDNLIEANAAWGMIFSPFSNRTNSQKNNVEK